MITAVGAGGIRPDPLEPGLHWIIPGAGQDSVYDVSRQTYTMSATTGEGQVNGDD